MVDCYYFTRTTEGKLMGRPKLIEDGVRISTVISKQQHDRLKHMSIKMSSVEGRQIGVSEAIRMAIEAAYPVPQTEQMDMFDGNRK
jgi:hypothetical protein